MGFGLEGDVVGPVDGLGVLGVPVEEHSDVFLEPASGRAGVGEDF